MKRTTQLKLVLASDQPAVLQQLKSRFDEGQRFHVCASVRSAGKLLSRLERGAGDLIVMDSAIDTWVEGSGDRSWPLLRELRQRYPDTPVVVLTEHRGYLTVRAIHDAGAAGIAGRQDDFRDIERVCRRVLSGMTGILSKRLAALCGPAWSFNGAPVYRGVRMRVSVQPFIAQECATSG
jgi:DNA-binding NarL/FixJ family response regulator